MEINIAQILNSNSAIFHSEGLQIYELLEPGIKSDQNITLSFDNLENCSTQFLNASIGKLYVEFEKEKIEFAYPTQTINMKK